MRVAHDVVGVRARVVDERRGAGARDAPVDAVTDGLLDEQELRHHLGQRAAARHEPQHSVAVQALDRREVEGERAVQLVHDDPGQLVHVVRGRQARGQARRERELRAQVGELAGRGHALYARVRAMGTQRLRTAAALTNPGEARRTGG